MRGAQFHRILGITTATCCGGLVAILAFAPLYSNEGVEISSDGSVRATGGAGTLWSTNPSAHAILLAAFAVIAVVGLLSLAVAWGRRGFVRVGLAVLLAGLTALGVLGAASIGLMILPIAALGWFTFGMTRGLHGKEPLPR